MDDLKPIPCAHCGADLNPYNPTGGRVRWLHVTGPDDCFNVRVCLDSPQAIAAWNRRTPPPVPESVKEAYRGEIALLAACRSDHDNMGALIHNEAAKTIRETLAKCGYSTDELED